MLIQETQDPSAVLWLDEIQDAILKANQDTKEALQCKNTNLCATLVFSSVQRTKSQTFACVSAVSQALQAVNQAVDSGDVARTLAALRNPGAGLYGVTSECAQTYQDDLARIKEEKKKEGEEKKLIKFQVCKRWRFLSGFCILKLH